MRLSMVFACLSVVFFLGIVVLPKIDFGSDPAGNGIMSAAFAFLLAVLSLFSGIISFALYRADKRSKCAAEQAAAKEKLG